MANTRIQIRRTSTAGRAANSTYINAGELGLNMADQILYSMDASNTVFSIGANVVTQVVTNNILVGNSTINISANSTSLMVGNVGIGITTTCTSITVGNSTVNSMINATAIVIGNSTVNTLVVNTYISGNGFGLTSLTASVAPAGANQQIQFNDSAAAGVDAAFTWDKSAHQLNVGNSTINVNINSTSLDIASINTTATGLTITNNSLTVGNSVANMIISFPTGMTAGNATVFTLSNSSVMAVGTINATCVGTLLSNNLFTIGNSSVNVTANSTTFSGIALTANNATNLGGVGSGSYINTIGNYTLSGNITYTPAAVGGIPINIRGVASGTANLFQVGNNTTAAQFAVNSIGIAVGNGAGLTSCQPAPGASLVVTAGVTTVNLTATSGLATAGGLSVLANAGVVANSTGTWAPGAGLKSFCVPGPLASDVYPIFWTNTAVTITEIVTVVTNTAASPGINTAFYSGTTLGTVVATILGTTNTSNITTGLHTTSFSTAAVAANSWVWCNVNTVSSINTFAATIRLV